MGLGKTVQVIGAINANPAIKRVLVVCPKSLLITWKAELERWLTRELSVAIVKSGADYPSVDADVVLINYELVTKHKAQLLVRMPWDALICDEAHYLKNPSSKRTTGVFGELLKAVKTREAPDGYPIQAMHMWLLTGSPMLNHPIELWPLLRALDTNATAIPRLGSFYGFRDRYCDPRHNGYGWVYTGVSHQDELKESITRSGLMLRRTKDQVLKLPEKQRKALVVESKDAEARESALIAELLADREAKRKNGGKRGSRGGGGGGEGEFSQVMNELGVNKELGYNLGYGDIMRLRRLHGVAKLPLAIEAIRSIVDEAGSKVVVWAHHIEVVQGLSDAFPGGASVKVDGQTSMEGRATAVTRFQHDPACRIFVGSIRAAGQGLTLTAASRVLFVEMDWSPMVLLQAEDRCHRIGQSETLRVQYLMIGSTIDQTIGDLLQRKMEAMQPLYVSLALAQVPPDAREASQLAALIDEAREREQAAKEGLDAAKREADEDRIATLDSQMRAAEEGARATEEELRRQPRTAPTSGGGATGRKEDDDDFGGEMSFEEDEAEEEALKAEEAKLEEDGGGTRNDELRRDAEVVALKAEEAKLEAKLAALRARRRS